jgi:hypothetical protein
MTMTREEILALEGQALNDEVALHVMGWGNDNGVWVDTKTFLQVCSVDYWNPCKSIEDAWMVLQNILARPGAFFLMLPIIAGMYAPQHPDQGESFSDGLEKWILSEDAPAGICRAALIIVLLEWRK